MTDDSRGAIAHLWRRAGFGARPEQLDSAVAAGYEAAVENLLRMGADPVADAPAPPTFDTAGLLAGLTSGDVTQRKAAQEQIRRETEAMVQWWLNRMIRADQPLTEKLTLFWHGHFATSIDKVRVPELMYRQNRTLRGFGAGDFETLTLAVADDPAMLIWLDGNADHRLHPNENFARELLELFVLGIGHYTEQDVKEAARAFTGRRYVRLTDTVRSFPGDHDDGVKTFLGRQGRFTGADIIRIATHRPESARFVVSKVWSHFAAPIALDDPVVTELVAAYGDTLDVKAVLRAMFLHPAFLSVATRTGLVKTPVEYVVGTLRALGLEVDRPGYLAVLRGLGQLPFEPPNVGGWPQNGYWLTTASSLLRLRFALGVVARADLSTVTAAAPADCPEVVARLLGVDAWTSTTRAVLADEVSRPRLLVALALVSPEYVLA